ncbi:hypothetical protein HY772_05800 [Candidatus Woesearchaeota archaeon]|nr:hypothetical protein [Candidatus Woesearchaeota archaeon]
MTKKRNPLTKKRASKPSLLAREEKEIKHVEHELEEEFFVPSPVHHGRYVIPVGIKVLIWYLVFLGIFYVVSFAYGITFPTTILLGKLVTGTRALIINAVLLLLIVVMIYGFWKRKAFTFDLAISWFGFTLVNALISLLLFESREYAIFRSMLFLSLVTMVLINVFVIWYILHERKYFYAEYFRDRGFHHRDKVFTYTLVSFWTLSLLIGFTLGMKFYDHSKTLIDQVIKEAGNDYNYGEQTCLSKAGEAKDVCFLVLASGRNQAGITQDSAICDKIESDVYRFTCLRSIASKT